MPVAPFGWEGRELLTTVTITIGRNIGTRPMRPAAWALFRAKIDALVSDTAEEVYVRDARGRGVWDGTEEENGTWVFRTRLPAGAHVDALAGIAREYGQDAIAYTRGETVLAGL